MGAWGVDTFENDTACDWKYGLEEISDLSYVETSLNSVLEAADDYIDEESGAGGLAACEVIARLKGAWGKRDSYTEMLDKWVEAHPQQPSPAIVQLATQVIDAILSENSELREIWEDSGDYEAWRSSVLELRERVVA